MKFNSNTLIENLQADIREIILQANQLQHLPSSLLQQQPSPEKWSVAQVLQHLNIYSRHYINAIEKKLHHHQTRPDIDFRTGWLGNYFTNLMKPASNGTVKKKMKTPKNAEPSAQPDAKEMLDEFISHQHQLLNLLQIAKSANLDSIHIPTSLSKLIVLKLGDTFRFFAAHEQRHFLQVANILASIGEKSHTSVAI